MAYTRPYDVTKPLGNVLQARDIDLEFRNLKTDLLERLNTIFVDFTTDPAVIEPSVLGNVTGKYLSLDGHSFNGNNALGAINQSPDTYVLNDTGTAMNIYATVPIPPHCIIKNIAPTYDRDGQTCTAYLQYNSLGAITTLITLSLTGSGLQTLASPTVSLSVNAAIAYRIKITLGGTASFSPRLYHCRVQYDTPDCRYTL